MDAGAVEKQSEHQVSDVYNSSLPQAGTTFQECSARDSRVARAPLF